MEQIAAKITPFQFHARLSEEGNLCLTSLVVHTKLIAYNNRVGALINPFFDNPHAELVLCVFNTVWGLDESGRPHP